MSSGSGSGSGAGRARRPRTAARALQEVLAADHHATPRPARPTTRSARRGCGRAAPPAPWPPACVLERLVGDRGHGARDVAALLVGVAHGDHARERVAAGSRAGRSPRWPAPRRPSPAACAARSRCAARAAGSCPGATPAIVKRPSVPVRAPSACWGSSPARRRSAARVGGHGAGDAAGRLRRRRGGLLGAERRGQEREHAAGAPASASAAASRAAALAVGLAELFKGRTSAKRGVRVRRRPAGGTAAERDRERRARGAAAARGGARSPAGRARRRRVETRTGRGASLAAAAEAPPRAGRRAAGAVAEKQLAGTRCRCTPGPSTYSSSARGPYAWKCVR
jgi:hypothetical protein